MSDRTKTIITLSLLVVLAFFLRWQYIINTKFDNPLRADAHEYAVIAENLATAHVFSLTANPADSGNPARPPGYPIFLAGIRLLSSSFLSFYWTTLFIQCLLGAATVAITYGLARYAMSRPWAILTALLTAFSPHMIVMSAYLLTECLFTFLLMAGITLLVKACRDDTPEIFALAGFSLGLAIFVRPPLGIFPLLAAAVIYLCRRQDGEKRKTTKVIALFLLASFMVPASWSLWRSLPQNAVASGPDQLKTAVVCGIYPGINFKDLPGMPYREDPDFPKFMASSYPEIMAKVAGDIAREPARYLGWWLLGKPAMYWSGHELFNDGINFYPVQFSWFDNNQIMGGARWLMVKLQPILVLLAALALSFFLKGWRGDLPEPAAIATLLCLVLLGYFTLMFMALAPFPRYAMPLFPGLFILAVSVARDLAILGQKKYRGISG